MNFNPESRHRRTIRLRDYDYSQTGAYFVTVCVWNRECLFGEIRNGGTTLNESGEIVKKYWNAIPSHFSNVQTDEFIIMPNHIHGIIALSNVGAQFIAPFIKTTTERKGVMNHAPTIGEIVRAFKARCTHAINQIRNTPGIPLWQRNYFEHIIRSEKELNQARKYIMNNPMQWELDDENPKKN